MVFQRRRFFAFTLYTLVNIIPPAMADVYARYDYLLCVVNNIDNYLGAANDPVLVFLDKCPSVSVSELEVLDYATNSLPALSSKQQIAQSVETLVISFRKKELDCLARFLKSAESRSEDGLVLLPENICEVQILP